MLNNIAAKLCFELGSKEIILWNSDLWCVKEEYFLEILERHRKQESKVSGTKLVYPPLEISLNSETDSENIKNTFPQLMGGKWREKIQFGGDRWIGGNKYVNLLPYHFKRFADKENPLVNCDRGSFFVTGAFQIWDLNYYLSIGGLNPSLSKNFQDVDICLKVIESGRDVHYFGKDLFFYHDESLNMHSLKNEKKNDQQMTSDFFLFGKLWNEKLPSILG